MLNATEAMVNSNVSDPLASRLAEHDAAGFDELALHHRHITNTVLSQLECSDKAEDVVQDVFLSAMKNLKGFRGESGLCSWLRQIAVNKCRSHWRKVSVRRRVLASAAGALEWVAPAQPETVATERETFSRVRQAVQALPQHYRQVVILWYFEQIPTAEVAAALTISPAIVRLRLHRARRHLRGLLADLVD